MNVELIEPATYERAPCACANAAPAIGAVWPIQGGVYAGIVRGEAGQPDAHLIIATDPRAEFKDVQWGKYGQDVPAAAKFDGLANTRAMAEAGSQIARDVLALDIDGHTDWHIGSQAQAHVAFANCADLFEKDWYWTSTQDSRSNAFVQVCEDGDSYWSGKDGDCRVRAFRVIPLQPLNA
jgi:hypothetical protein